MYLKFTVLDNFINPQPLTFLMNFQSLVKVETPRFYLDVAFRRANNKLKLARQKIIKNRFEKSKQLELLRIEIINDSLINSLKNILVSFPSIDSMPKFYNELVKVTLDYPNLKKSLGAVNWCSNKIANFFIIYKNKIKNTKDAGKINQYRREFNGRVSSVLKQITENLRYLEESRRIMKEYPIIKTSLFTAVITGFPNVGKTTLMYKLSGSKPEINSYPFTTRNLNLAFVNNIQLIDAPGALDRFGKMNNIEKQAYLALKYCCDLIIYVIDLTEPYPLDKQLNLLNNLKEYNKDMLIYLSKQDLIDKNKFDEFSKRYNALNIKELSEELFSYSNRIKKHSDKDISSS